MQHCEADDRVERRVGKGQGGAVSSADVDPVAERPAKSRGQVGIDLHRSDPPTALKEPARRHTIARTDLQHVALKRDALARPRQHL